MKDRELDKKLEQARIEADRFFENLKFAPYRKIVQKKINNSSDGKRRFQIGLLNNKKRIKGVAIIGIFIFLTIFLVPKTWDVYRYRYVSKQMGSPILQQSVKLDNRRLSHWFNFFMLNNPGQKDHNLLAVLWKMEPDGKYKMIYSSLLEETDIPKPPMIMEMPQTNNKFILISSKNKNKEYLHYRLISYEDNTIKTYLEENFIPDGKIEIKKGTLLEEKVQPDEYLKTKSEQMSMLRKVVTRFVPYQFTGDGRIILSTNYVKLKKGDYLTLVGDNYKLVQVDFNKKLIKKVGERTSSDKTIQKTLFQAVESGIDFLKLRPDYNDSIEERLLIEVIEP